MKAITYNDCCLHFREKKSTLGWKVALSAVLFVASVLTFGLTLADFIRKALDEP